MRMTRQFLIAILSSLLIISCQKEITFETSVPAPSNPGSGSGDTLYRIQQGIDPDITEDTVLLISYNSAGKISMIVDSLNEDSTTVSYNANGKISAINDTHGTGATFKYNSGQLLDEVDIPWATTRYKFQYTGGVLSKCLEYTDVIAGGGLEVWSTTEYTISGGNVASAAYYDASNTKQFELTYSYGSELNPFKEIAIINAANWMGMGYLAYVTDGTFFNTNINTGTTIGTTNYKSTYTFNSKKKVIKAVATGDQAVYTWHFSYR